MSVSEDLVVLILSTSSEQYDSFKLAQRKTWVKDMRAKGIKCFFYHGGESHNFIDDDTIYLNSPDDLGGTSKKLKSALSTVLDYYPETKLVYRTNLSTYIDVNKFINAVNSIKSVEKIYCGSGSGNIFNLFFEKIYFHIIKAQGFLTKINLDGKLTSFLFVNFNSFIRRLLLKLNKSNNFSFCSGSGLFIGRDEITSIIQDIKYDKLIDDVMIRLVIDRNPDFFIDRFDFTSKFKPIHISEYEDRLDNNLFQYRMKTQNRNIDAQLLYAIDCKFIRKKLVTKINS
ncbi:hypothetical protein BCS98_15310 [Vibrio breoganii]|uniref:hypothetical protein n=1 Tax=Vibrio breoganii TaxID=553239 RepID=UPI000C852987|nr:hypothetical protein [Vibrio breoganii]PMO90160.1 hypothetical protein BCS98_15310 [Vibrio breoganii]